MLGGGGGAVFGALPELAGVFSREWHYIFLRQVPVDGVVVSGSSSVDESMLTEAERKQVEEFSKKIDITDSNQVMQYGSAAQKNIASFSENALNNVKTKDLGEVGNMISSLVVELKSFDAEEERKGLRGLFKKTSDNLEAMKAKYAKAEVNVDKIAGTINGG